MSGRYIPSIALRLLCSRHRNQFIVRWWWHFTEAMPATKFALTNDYTWKSIRQRFWSVVKWCWSGIISNHVEANILARSLLDFTWLDSKLNYRFLKDSTKSVAVGHSFQPSPTDGQRHAALGLFWWLPIQVLAENNVSYLQWTRHWASFGRYRKTDIFA